MISLTLIVILFSKKNITPFCIAGICICGYAISGNIVYTLIFLGKAVLNSSLRLMNVIVTIALITGMSEAMTLNGSSDVLVRPFGRVIRNRTTAFLVLGITMLLMSWLFWPSPAVVIIGAVLVPVATKAGLPPIWCAVCMNIFGHGIALSSDYVIQGAPALTAQAAGITTTEIISASVIPWSIMSVVTVIAAFFAMKKDGIYMSKIKSQKIVLKLSKKSVAGAVLMVSAFVINIIFMYIFKVSGDDATYLIGGTAIAVTIIICIIHSGLRGINNSMDCIQKGFIYAVKVFTPVIIIGAFFFLGNQNFCQEVMGNGAPAIINDIGKYYVEHIHVTGFTTILIEAGTAFVTALDGSGFSGLVLTGSMAQTLSGQTHIDCAALATVGQLIAIWTGGGTLIPWSVVPVAAVCHVDARQLAAKNLIPVLCGGAAMIIYVVLIL